MNEPATLTQLLSIDHPILQAPMAGGGDTPELVAAVCEAGGMGCIGAAYLTPDQIREAARAVRARTRRPFGINLFAPQPTTLPADPGAAIAAVAPHYAELGLPPPGAPSAMPEPFFEQLPAVLESGASLFSFTFGRLPAEAFAALKAKGFFVVGTATTVREAVVLWGDGVDAVVAQGSEAGGHRGSFLQPGEESLVGGISLIPLIADAVKVPVIASGGIMDGRGIAAALLLGASAVQLGTAFLTCDEAGASEAYKAAVLAARDEDTRITRAFSGRPARGINNRFLSELSTRPILPFPLQNALTRPMRTAAAKAGRAEFLSLWAGQGAPLARSGKAADLVARLVREAQVALERGGQLARR